MSPRLASAAALLTMACGPTDRARPDNGWPPILDEHRSYVGTGGAQPGDRIAAFSLPDQHGAETDLRQFLGFVTVIEVGATWCVPCQDAARTQQAFLEELQVDPVWILSVLAQDASGGPPDPGDAAVWAQQFGLELPVLADVLQERQQDWSVGSWPTT